MLSSQQRSIFLMEYRQLGGSGFKVPALSLGTGTFGGRGYSSSRFGVNG